jgi:hypothetical protein
MLSGQGTETPAVEAAALDVLACGFVFIHYRPKAGVQHVDLPCWERPLREKRGTVIPIVERHG